MWIRALQSHHARSVTSLQLNSCFLMRYAALFELTHTRFVSEICTQPLSFVTDYHAMRKGTYSFQIKVSAKALNRLVLRKCLTPEVKLHQNSVDNSRIVFINK